MEGPVLRLASCSILGAVAVLALAHPAAAQQTADPNAQQMQMMGQIVIATGIPRPMAPGR
jgi:hypothetical protein